MAKAARPYIRLIKAQQSTHPSMTARTQEEVDRCVPPPRPKVRQLDFVLIVPLVERIERHPGQRLGERPAVSDHLRPVRRLASKPPDRSGDVEVLGRLDEKPDVHERAPYPAKMAIRLEISQTYL